MPGDVALASILLLSFTALAAGGAFAIGRHFSGRRAAWIAVAAVVAFMAALALLIVGLVPEGWGE